MSGPPDGREGVSNTPAPLPIWKHDLLSICARDWPWMDMVRIHYSHPVCKQEAMPSGTLRRRQALWTGIQQIWCVHTLKKVTEISCAHLSHKYRYTTNININIYIYTCFVNVIVNCDVCLLYNTMLYYTLQREKKYIYIYIHIYITMHY